MLHLDYICCFLTILSTILIGKRLWYGWIVAGLNSLVVCVIGVQTAQYGFLPGNLFCIALYAHNLSNWRLAIHRQAPASLRMEDNREGAEESAS
jgi:hypothetical protein